MKKLVIAAFAVLLGSITHAQTTVTGQNVVAKKALTLGNVKVDSIQKTGSLENQNTLPTSKAVKDWVTEFVASLPTGGTLQSVINANSFAETPNQVFIASNNGEATGAHLIGPEGVKSTWGDNYMNEEFSITGFGIVSTAWGPNGSGSLTVAPNFINMSTILGSAAAGIDMRDFIELRTGEDFDQRAYRMDKSLDFFITHNMLSEGIESAGFAILRNFKIRDTAYKNNSSKDSVLSTDEHGNFEQTLREGYKVYVAKISQAGSAEPVATVLRNTLGMSVTWVRDNAGEYTGSISLPALAANKVFLTLTPGSQQFMGGMFNYSFSHVDSQHVLIGQSRDGVGYDGMQELYIEIRVYP